MDIKKYTIKDVAELAGVSKGTVDRVLHKRGKVSQKAFEKVNKVLKQLDFQPNLMARNLRKNKLYKICALLPDPKYDSYWIPARKGIRSGAKEYKRFGVIVEQYLYNPVENISFQEKSREALSAEPNAILIAPSFEYESTELFRKCREQDILIALFDNHIDTIKGEFFIGQDLVQCGRIGANLIDKMVKKAKIAIVHINKEPHMQLKENGFKNYFERNIKGENQLITQNFNTRIAKNDFSFEISKFIRSNPDIKAIFVTNSKTYLIAKELEKLNFECTLIGFDLLDENIEYLEEGKIDFLIHQKPKRQAYLGIGYLAEYFLFGKPMPSQKLLPIDIITSENVKYHLK